MLDKQIIKFFIKEASSMVKSRDAYYAPASQPPQPPPLESMGTGNLETVQNQASQLSELHKQKNMQAMMAQPAHLGPSVQANLPMTTPPFRPKYTGMP